MLAVAGVPVAHAASGTFNITGTTATSATGNYVTPEGDTGTFTLTRTAATGLSGTVTFVGGGNGLQARNSEPSPVVTEGGDSFAYTLSLTPGAGQARSLIIELVQRTVQTTGNSEVARLNLSYGGAPYGTAAATVALNPPVLMHPTNVAQADNTTIPQLRQYTANPDPLVDTTPVANYPALAVGTAIPAGTNIQLFGVANADSAYRIDVTNATTMSLTYTGNNRSDFGGNGLLTGEVFNEWIGFGVRTRPASLTLAKQVGMRTLAADQFNVQIRDGATTLAQATTAGTGTTASTGATAVNDNTAYTLTEVITGSAAATYNKTIACTNANSGSPTTLPTGASATPTWSVTPIGGDAITCTITNITNAADLIIAKTNTPAAGANDQPADTVTSGQATTYQLTVTNNGPADVVNAVVTDTPTAGLDCPPANAVTCTINGTACPGGPFTVANLTGSGIVLPLLTTATPTNTAILSFSCTVQ